MGGRDVVEIPKRAKVFRKFTILAIIDYGEICSDEFQINKDILWQKIEEKLKNG